MTGACVQREEREKETETQMGEGRTERILSGPRQRDRQGGEEGQQC